jgi:DNA polymerase sigma
MNKVFATIFLVGIFILYLITSTPTDIPTNSQQVDCVITVDRVVDGDTIVTKDSLQIRA